MSFNDEIVRAFINDYRAAISYEKIITQKKREADEMYMILLAKELKSPKFDGMPTGGNISHDERLAIYTTKHAELEAEIEKYQARVDDLKERLSYIPERTQMALRDIYKAKKNTIEGYAALHGTSPKRLRRRINDDIVYSGEKLRKYNVIW